MNLEWLGGYALITETRTIDLPAGSSEIRFEGVADTLLPASVIVSGLPNRPAEKNYDARLLSPGALIDAFLGRQVHIRRTDKKTGRVTESEAIIRSGPNGVVLQTARGFEALRCTGLSETLVYSNVPEGLSDKPTLALRASSTAPIRTTVRLSYLASQFDWQANYLAMLHADGRSLDLFAWLTMANGNATSFPAAQTQAVAGEPNRENDPRNAVRPVSPNLNLSCWPSGNTSDVGTWPPPPAPPPPSAVMESAGAEIIVTGSRIPLAAMIATQEDLGDLKLYRIPEPVTVAANAQKQVALLTKTNVPVERYYALAVEAANTTDRPQPVSILIRMQNDKAGGLGLPLPSGRVAVFETVRGRPMLAGEPEIRDKTVGEPVELVLGESADVTYELRRTWEGRPNSDGNRPEKFAIRLTNARSQPALVEMLIGVSDDVGLTGSSVRLGTKNGRSLWRVTVPANKIVSLAYTLVPLSPKKGDD